jgi:hypothetical protein
MHVPINAPHFVQNDNDVSISLSIAFNTPYAERRKTIYRINHRLREAKLQPYPFGISDWRDELKFSMWQQYLKLKRSIA